MNKIRQTIVGLLLIIPFLSFAQQAPLWKVAIKNKTIEWTSQNDTSMIKLMNTKKAIIDFSYLAPEKVANSTQAIIMMDNTRKEIKRVTLEDNKASFNVKDLFNKTNKTEVVYVYSIATPKDFRVAKRARVGTQFIGKIVR